MSTVRYNNVRDENGIYQRYGRTPKPGKGKRRAVRGSHREGMDLAIREWMAVAVRHPGSYPGLATWFTVGVGLGVAASNAVRSQW